MDQLTLKKLIEHLQNTYKEHGNVPVYATDDARVFEASYYPTVQKIYSYKEYDMLNTGGLKEKDEELYDVNLEKPIIVGLVL